MTCNRQLANAKLIEEFGSGEAELNALKHYFEIDVPAGIRSMLARPATLCRRVCAVTTEGCGNFNF